MKIISFAAIAAVFTATSAHAAILNVDFDNLTRGSVVSTIDVDGVTGTLQVIGGTNEAIVFDTGNPGTSADGDPDLGAPFYDILTGPTPGPQGNPAPGGAATALDPKNVLIIGEPDDADRADDTNPDDNGRGGQIVIRFDDLVTFDGFDVFDDVSDFVVNAFVTGTQAPIWTTGPFSLAYNNQYRSFTNLGYFGIDMLVFDFKSASGAIDNLQFVVDDEINEVPVPASLPLMLAGLGAMGFAARRRKS